MTEDERKRILEEAEKCFEKTEKCSNEKPRIVVCGKTGSGKSSLINALLNRKANDTDPSKPTTQKEQEETWTLDAGSMRILDVPGFGEADKHQDRLDFIFDKLSSSHVGLLVVGAPDRAWEYERQFMQTVAEVDQHFPMLVVGNRIDMFNPVREWNPAALNLKNPSTQKEKSIAAWAAALQEACGVDKKRLILTSAGQSFEDVEGRYGLDHLARTVVENLPTAMQADAARKLGVDMDKRDLAQKFIWGASVAAAGIALSPIPFSDCIPLAGIQIGLIVKIANIYGRVMTKETAFNLLEPAVASFVGRMALENLLKFIPGIGTVTGLFIGAGLAGSITYAIGTTYLEFFARDNFTPSKEEVRDRLRAKYEEAKKKQSKLEEEARAQRKSA